MTREEKEIAINNNIICFSKLDAIKHAVVNNSADVYSEVASEIFHCSSDDCKEFRRDESGNFVKYADGKKRRDVAKYLIDRECEAINAYSFITLIRGYCILPYYQKKFNQIKEGFWSE